MRRTQGMPSASSRAAVRRPIMPAPQMHTRSTGINTSGKYICPWSAGAPASVRARARARRVRARDHALHDHVIRLLSVRL